MSASVLIAIYTYTHYILCTNGQQHMHGSHDAPHHPDVNSTDNTMDSSHNGDTAIMGFVVITICCLFGCCINMCLRSSRRQRRRRRRIISGLDSNAIQLFTLNNESIEEFEEESECTNDTSCNDNNSGISINLDEYKTNDDNDKINDIDIEAIKREKTICVICHDQLSGNIRILECNHIFCSDCIVLWEKEGKCLCPICRQPTCSTKYIQKKKNTRQSNSLRNNQRVVIITQNPNNGTHNLRLLTRNNSPLQIATMPVHAFLL